MANETGQITLLPTKSITTALTGWVSDPFKFSASFPKVFTAQGRFIYGGAGGTTCKAWVQTSLDDGATWNDIMCFSFTTASKRTIGAVNNFQAAGSGTDLVVPTDGTLAADKVVNGVLGNYMRVKITSTGTYGLAAATGVITYNNAVNVTDTKKVSVNGKDYTFVTGPVAAEGDVLIAGSSDASFTNLVRAINKSGGVPGTDYLVAAANPDVTAAIVTGTDTVTLTAITPGFAGNSLTLTSDEPTATVSDFAAEATGSDATYLTILGQLR